MIGRNIQILRKRRNLTQEALAEAVGVARQTIAKWETGDSSPDLESAGRLAVALDVALDDLVSAPSEELDEAFAGTEAEDLRYVWDAVSSLPVKYREVIHLFYQEGYSTKEISTITGRKEATVRSDLHRAREELKEILRESYDFE